MTTLGRQLIVAPSILSADFSDMSRALALMAESGAPWIHMDVMDGHFVPNLTFGPKMVADIRKNTSAVLDVHLMIEKPELSIDQYIDAGADYLTFHVEACVHAHRLLDHIRKRGIKAGISLVPGTPVQAVAELLDGLDLVLVMSVNPGFGGQTIIPRCVEKIRQLSAMRKESGGQWLISVDGGIHGGTIDSVINAGVDIAVAGSAFFSAPDPGILVKDFMDRAKALGNPQ